MRIFSTDWTNAVRTAPDDGGGLSPHRIHSGDHAAILDGMAQGICVYAADGRLVEINAAARRMLGPTGMVPTGRARRRDGSLLAAEDYPIAACLRTGLPAGGETLAIESADGLTRWLRIECRPADGGRLAVASFLDVTEQVEAEARIAATERTFRAIFENAFEFMGLLAADGTVLAANATALSFIGRSELGDLTGVHFADTPWWEHSPADRARLKQGIAQAAAGELVRFETTHVDRAGGIAYVDFSLRPVRDERGEVTYLIPEGRDVTARKRVEAALLSAKLEAEAANRRKDEFLAAISHELRTPLNAIIGFSEAIIEEALGPPEAARTRDYLKMVHAAGLHLRLVTDDILDIARAELGHVVLDEEVFPSAVLVRDVVSMVASQAAGKDIRIDCRLGEPPPLLLADPRRLRQVVVNLLSNAVKFSPPGGRIVVEARESPDGFEIIVADDGPSIAPAQMARIWLPFQQANPMVARKHAGAGLGLPIVRHYVEAHGGQVTLDCPPEGGTVARVVLPRARLEVGAGHPAD